MFRNLQTGGRIFSLAFLFVTAALIFVIAIGPGETQGANTLIVGLPTDIPVFDAAQATGLHNFGIINQVTETLTLLGQDGEVLPHLAEKWEQSANGKIWTIRLRRGVKFHDGTPFNAEAVKFNIERFRKLSIGKASLDMIKELTVIDASTIRITTDEPFAPLMAHLAYGPVAMNSPKQVEKLGADYPTHPVGTGPFRFVRYNRGVEAVLEANEQYWGGKPKLDYLKMRPLPDTGARIMALESGDVDAIFNIPPTEAARLESDNRVQLIEVPSTRGIRLYLNTQWGPLKDKRVRQAVMYAIDRDAIVKSIFLGKAKVSRSAVPSAAWGYHDVDTYRYDPKRSLELLGEAGYPRGFSMTVHFSPGRYLLDSEVVAAIQMQLLTVGINMKVVSMEWAALARVQSLPLNESPVQSLLMGWAVASLDADRSVSDFASTYWPPNGNNLSFYKNDKIDALVPQERAAVDKNSRRQILRQIQETVMDELPAIWLYEEPHTWAISRKVKGFAVDPNTAIYPAHNIWIDTTRG